MVYKKAHAVLSLWVCGLFFPTAVKAEAIDVYPNADGTVGMRETAEYKNRKDLKVRLMPGTRCVGTGAFKGWNNLLSVVCEEADGEDGVTVGAAAFKDCSRLQSVFFNKTGDIGAGAFEGCKALTTLDVFYSKNIHRWAFKNCTSLIALYVCKDAYWVDRTGALEGCPNVRVFEREP